ncbi:beta-lactamase/transpeptidase-like protein [Aspergillus carlsbadensis]|nr:beta-lactamase/transpeptidase-like protein [Aspergillus carlsbadensis]
MTDFDQVLTSSTTPGANIVPGCVLAAVNKAGLKFYNKAVGSHSVHRDAPMISPDGTFWLASCSKLIGTIAALQCVERGQVTLDEPVQRILPELASPQIIEAQTTAGKGKVSEGFSLRPAVKKITLRHLLCHTSGISYDMFHPLLMSWRSSRHEAPLGLTGKVAEAYTLPLLFEPGDGWSYGGGIDWAGELVARLNGVSLEEYCQTHIFGPLALVSTTFRLANRPDVKERLVDTSERSADGTLKPSVRPWPDEAPEDCAGGSLYSSSDDYVKLLADLLSDHPRVLAEATVESMFAPQLEGESRGIKDLEAATIFTAMTGITGSKGGINWGLGGLKGSLVWGGLPNLIWFANREQGIAAFYASQVLPPGDPHSGRLANGFMEEVWRIAGKV